MKTIQIIAGPFEIKDLVELKKKESEIKSSDYPTFNEFWNKKWMIGTPLRFWSQLEFNKACREKGLLSIDDIHSFVYSNDMNCINVDLSISGIIKDTEEFKVTAWIDYDCDTCMCKFIVKHKPSGLFYKNSINLGTKYLSGGIKIEIS
jgi:hypothetical protein